MNLTGTLVAACHCTLDEVAKTGVQNHVYIAFVFLDGIVPLDVSLYAWLAAFRVALRYMKHKEGEEVGAELFKRSQRLLEIFVSLLMFAILWVTLAVMAFIITANPELPSEVYIICWLFHLCNPLFQLVVTSLQVRLNF